MTSSSYESVTSPLQRIVVSLLLVTWLMLTFVQDLTQVQRDEPMPLQSMIITTGLEQNWGMFSPNVPYSSQEIVAHLTFDDGTTMQWRRPTGTLATRNFVHSRWRLVTWRAASGQWDMDRKLSEFLVREFDSERRRVVTIVLELEAASFVSPHRPETIEHFHRHAIYRYDAVAGKGARL